MTVAITVTAAGAQPTPPSTLRTNLINAVAAEYPGYTADLPNSLISDIEGTDVGALTMIDQACVDLLNSVSPLTANSYLNVLQGAQQGITPGLLNNSSAYILFTGLAGYVINKGFIVSDGAHQYTVQDAGILGNAVATSFTASQSLTTLSVSAIPSGQIMVGDTIVSSGTTQTIQAFLTGTGGIGDYQVSVSQTIVSGPMTGTTHGTATLYAVANDYGTWAIPANSITSLITSVPTGYPMKCSNPLGGTIATSAENASEYRARIAQSQLAPSVGSLSYLKTKIEEVAGTQARLVSVSGANKILVGGGDPYAIANAIIQGQFDYSRLIGSSVLSNSWTGTGSILGDTLTITARTGTILAGDILSSAGNLASPTYIIKQLTGAAGDVGTYQINYSQILASGAISGSNSLRNQIVSIVDYPDTYAILFVVPVAQTVKLACTWSTIAPNFTSNAAVESAVKTAWAAYVNSIYVGVAINIYELKQLFLEAVASIVNPAFISALDVVVTINGSVITPPVGTGLAAGDSEGYFNLAEADITLTRV